jgi:hypothetical protein
MSMRSALGTAAVLFGEDGAIVEDGEVAFGVVLVAGWAITGAAIVKAKRPSGNRENLNIVVS